MRLPGKPISNEMADSRNSICFSVRRVDNAWILSFKCSTLRPPTMENTFGALHRTYANAIAVTDSIPCSTATVASASDTGRSSSVCSAPNTLRSPSPCFLRSSICFADWKCPPPRASHRGEGHSEMARHGEDIPLEIAAHHVPAFLVDGERGFAAHAGIGIGC